MDELLKSLPSLSLLEARLARASSVRERMALRAEHWALVLLLEEVRRAS